MLSTRRRRDIKTKSSWAALGELGLGASLDAVSCVACQVTAPRIDGSHPPIPDVFFLSCIALLKRPNARGVHGTKKKFCSVHEGRGAARREGQVASANLDALSETRHSSHFLAASNTSL